MRQEQWVPRQSWASVSQLIWLTYIALLFLILLYIKKKKGIRSGNILRNPMLLPNVWKAFCSLMHFTNSGSLYHRVSLSRRNIDVIAISEASKNFCGLCYSKIEDTSARRYKLRIFQVLCQHYINTLSACDVHTNIVSPTPVANLLLVIFSSTLVNL